MAVKYCDALDCDMGMSIGSGLTSSLTTPIDMDILFHAVECKLNN